MHSAAFSRSSSRNWSGTSRSSSSSSVGAQGSRDDIESYLSMFKGKEGKREVGRAVDWGKLLDGRETLENTKGLRDRVSEEDEQEDAEEEAASMFLKPKTKYVPSPKCSPQNIHAHPQQKHSDTRCSDRPDSRKMMRDHTAGHIHLSSGRGLGVNVTTAGSHLNSEPGEGDISTSTDTMTEHRSLHEREDQFEGLVPKDTLNTDGLLLEHTQSQRLGDSVPEESESELSLSRVFKNNILSLDQLEAPVQPSLSGGNQLSPCSTTTSSATEGEVDDNSWESHLPYKLHSLTELESPTVDRNALEGQEGADDDEEMGIRGVHAATDTPQGDRLGAMKSDAESSSSEEIDKPYEGELKMEDAGRNSSDSEALSYEEDFESSTVSERSQELETDPSAALGAQEERGETTSDEKSTEQYESHTYEGEEERNSMAQWETESETERTNASSGANSAGGGAGTTEHQEVGSAHDDKLGLHKGTVKHDGASEQKGKGQTHLLSPTSPENRATQADSHGTPRPRAPTPLILPEQDHLHPSPLPPPITADTSASSLVSDTLQDLLRAQLALTKHLITRSRTLAEQISASLTPNYHYTTLEETKRYISKNRPKILSSEEAREILAREDN